MIAPAVRDTPVKQLVCACQSFSKIFPNRSYFGSLVLILVSFGLYKVPLSGNGSTDYRPTGLLHRHFRRRSVSLVEL